jgi:ubiquinone/menaquinone biosynthesis C-methylase UbiE
MTFWTGSSAAFASASDALCHAVVVSRMTGHGLGQKARHPDGDYPGSCELGLTAPGKFAISPQVDEASIVADAKEPYPPPDEEMEGMEGPYLGKLRVWEGWIPTAVQELAAPVQGNVLPGPHQLAQYADQLYAREALNPAAPRLPSDEGAEPYSLQWFLHIEHQRHSRQGRWIPRLLEFAKHSGETLLGLGIGLGTDWLQYARHGATVIVCSPAAEQLALIRRNFELRGLPGRFLHARAGSLPLENASIDVVCLSSHLHEIGEPQTVVDEIYRVLKPGGKVLAVTPARYDVDYWNGGCFPWQGWFSPAALEVAQPARFSRRQLRRLFWRFTEHRIHKRHLRRAETPHFCRLIPLSILERLMGHLLVLKAFKPLSAAIGTQMAA